MVPAARRYQRLLSVAVDARRTEPTIAWDAVGVAATVVHQTGLNDVRTRVRAAR